MDSLYRVILSLETQGNLGTNVGHLTQKLHEAHGAIGGLREAGRTMGETIQAAAEKMGSALERAADRAFEVTKHIAEIGGAAGLGLAAYGVAHLNRELEETKLSLATVFQTQGFASNFGGAMSIAEDQMSKMKKDVKSLPGDLGQLSDIMKMIATPAAQGGASADQIRALAGRGMLVARVLGVQNQEQAARELASLFAGRAGSHNILGSRMGLIGEEAQRFNKESAQDRVKEITKLFNTDAMNSAATAFAHTWTAQITTLADNVKYLMLAPATSGLFERIKHAIGEVNDYIDAHQAKIEDIAHTVSDKLVGAWDYLESKFKKIEPILASMAGHILKMDPGMAAQHLAVGGGVMAAGKIGGMALEGAGSGIGMLTKLLGSGGAGLEALGSAVAVLADPITLAAAAAAAGGLAVAAVAVGGAFDDLTDKSSAFHDEAIKDWADIQKNIGVSLSTLVDAGKTLGEAMRPLADTLGIGLLDIVKDATLELWKFSNAIQDVATVIAFFLGKDIPIPHQKIRHEQEMVSVPVVMRPDDQSANAKKGAGLNGAAGTTIQKVEIVVKGNDDPSRVARLTVKELEKFARNPRQSKYVPEYSRP